MTKVVLAIIEKDKKILIVKRKKDDGITWSFPGGKVEENETSQEAVIREVKEECNIECEAKELLGTRIHPVTQVKIEYWFCKYKNGEAKVTSQKEILEIKWITIEEILKLFGENLFVNIKKFLIKKLR